MVQPAIKTTRPRYGGIIAMLDLLHAASADHRDSASLARLIEGIDRQLGAVLASKGRGDPEQVARAEAEVSADPARCIRLNDHNLATVYAAGRAYQGGLFEVPTLSELRARAQKARERAGRPRARCSLWVFDGASPLTDIGALQATAPPGTLFQVASQFNCLEAPGSYVAPVAEYFSDPTQGPRASISAFPGTLVRHYAAPAPDGSRFVQTTEGRQLNLLEAVCTQGVAAVRSGYLRAADVKNPAAFASALQDHFESIRVGVHDAIEVVLGYDWQGDVACAPHRTIAQVLTSTIAGGMYGEVEHEDAAFGNICRLLQRAAYLGTLLAAAALGKERVVLTLIGGGVFANPVRVIWEAIKWATEQVSAVLHRDLLVVVNGRSLSIPETELRATAYARGGALLRFDRGGVTVLGA
jgi:hypothetical protein